MTDGGAIGRRHELDGGLGQSGALQAGDEGGMDGERRVEAFRASAQYRRVAGFDGQRAGVGRHVRAAFVDDADDAERHAHALKAQTVGPYPFGQHRTDRIGQLGDLPDAVGDPFDARLVEQQPVDECRRPPGSTRGFEILGVGGEDRRRRFTQCLGRGAQRLCLCFG